MEQEKLTNQKEALAFLCNKYPTCFFKDGPVKPLKIGIFQDIAGDLEGSEIVSKRLLRLSLRHYTSSWRYLSAVKAGVARIDLLGEEGDVVEEQHAEHALEQLKESKAKAAKYRENNPKSSKNPASKHKGYPSKNTDGKSEGSTSDAGTKQKHPKSRDAKKLGGKHKSKPNQTPQGATRAAIPQVPITDGEIQVGKQALVKLGKEPMPVTITDIAKDGISVQLNSGMTVKVKQAQLFSAPKAANK
jgi:ProP effector